MLGILLIDIHPRKVIPNKNNKNHLNRAHGKAELENTKSEPNSITKGICSPLLTNRDFWIKIRRKRKKGNYIAVRMVKKQDIQMTLTQHRFELHGSTYISIFFFVNIVL